MIKTWLVYHQTPDYIVDNECLVRAGFHCRVNVIYHSTGADIYYRLGTLPVTELRHITPELHNQRMSEAGQTAEADQGQTMRCSR